ncbi:MAG: hypothetical protein J6C98_09615 [Oscillospiraceae bacterium]|nr:hypothetical protein [Oscillospiraceae bacterium]
MADKAIGDLVAATQVTASDLFVLEQSGAAKKLTGQVLENWLVSFADGHGGIQSIEKTGSDKLADTYRITLADTTFFEFVVTNGRGITGISKTATKGLVDTYTISYSDGTSGSFEVTNGAKGDPGAAYFVWIKYASVEPTEESHSFGDLPDDWIGVYSGTAAAAPADWTQYRWFRIKGEKGDVGDPAQLVSSEVAYQASASGTVIPSGSWSAGIPSVSQGKYLWTRVTETFNSGDPVVSYSVSRMGIDGAGSVSSVNSISPDSDGNVSLTAEDIGALAASESASHPGCYCRTVDGETEWLNPPMIADVEYRTAERFYGKVVYAKTFTTTDADGVSVSMGDDVSSIVRIHGRCGLKLLPVFGSDGACAVWADVDGKTVTFHVASGQSTSVELTVWYVKTS